MMLEGIISKCHKFIYFPIPKVACTSVKIALANVLDVKLCPYPYIHESSFPIVKVNKPEKFKHYFKFCFVRNPWSRIFSCYREKIRNKDYNGYTFINGVFNGFLRFKKFRGEMCFDEFVDVLRTIPDQKADPHFKSQHTFITNERNELIVDFLGRFEYLGRDFSYICKKIGLSNIEIPHVNKITCGEYRKYYTKRTCQIVRERYALDISVFNYEF